MPVRVAALPGRAREAVIRIISLPACLSQALHIPGRGEKVGAGTSPDRLRLLLLSSLWF